MTDLNGVNNALQNGYTIKLENRGSRSSGITFELKAVFDEMAKKGLIKDKDGNGLTKQDAMNMYNKLNEIHKADGKATNYTRMQAGQEFSYSTEQLLELIEASGYEVVQEESKGDVPSEKVPDLTVQPEEKEADIVELPKEMDINHPPVEYESEPEPAPKPQLEKVPDDAKMEKRDIVNIGDKGSKEVVVTTKNKDGVKVYRQAVQDPETNEIVYGSRLAVDTRGAKKNEYYAIDETIPDGVEVDTNKTVDGKKNQMTYTIKDENGKTHRYSMVQNDDGTYAKGEELVSVCGSGKFISQTALNKLVATIFPKGLPEGVEVQVMDRNGETTPIFKKDGKLLNNAELRKLAQAGETPKVEGGKPAEAPKSNTVSKLTPEQVEEFVAQDKRVHYLECQLDDLKELADDLEEKHNAARKAHDIDAMQEYSSIAVHEAKANYNNSQRAINSYKNILSKWQDGSKYVLQTGEWAGSKFETVTLPSGQKGYKFERVENGQNVLYYFNIDFNPKMGIAGGLGNMVERCVLDNDGNVTDRRAFPEKYSIGDETFISNMLDVVTSKYPDASVSQGEFGFEITTPDGRTLNFGNTPEELDKIDAFMRGEEVE